MKFTVEKKEMELTERNIAIRSTVYISDGNETLDSLLERMRVSGKLDWHFSDLEIRIKLIKE